MFLANLISRRTDREVIFLLSNETVSHESSYESVSDFLPKVRIRVRFGVGLGVGFSFSVRVGARVRVTVFCFFRFNILTD